MPYKTVDIMPCWDYDCRYETRLLPTELVKLGEPSTAPSTMPNPPFRTEHGGAWGPGLTTFSATDSSVYFASLECSGAVILQYTTPYIKHYQPGMYFRSARRHSKGLFVKPLATLLNIPAIAIGSSFIDAFAACLPMRLFLYNTITVGNESAIRAAIELCKDPEFRMCLPMPEVIAHVG